MKAAHGPTGGGLGYIIEPLQVIDAGHNLVMIAAHDGVAVGPGPFNDFRGMRIVADQVAAADNPLVLALRRSKHRLERIPVGVQIAYEEVSHRRINVISGGAPNRTGTPIVPSPELTYSEEPGSS